MGFGRATTTCLRKHGTFSDRASRSEFWWFVAAVCLAGTIAPLLDYAIFGASVRDQTVIVFDGGDASDFLLRGAIFAVMNVSSEISGLGTVVIMAGIAGVAHSLAWLTHPAAAVETGPNPHEVSS